MSHNWTGALLNENWVTNFPSSFLHWPAHLIVFCFHPSMDDFHSFAKSREKGRESKEIIENDDSCMMLALPSWLSGLGHSELKSPTMLLSLSTKKSLKKISKKEQIRRCVCVHIAQCVCECACMPLLFFQEGGRAIGLWVGTHAVSRSGSLFYPPTHASETG